MSNCGTVTGYRRGCRCQACRDAQSAANRSYRERVGPRGPGRQLRPCGTIGAYNRGCRCAACRAAKAEHGREFRKRHPGRRYGPTKPCPDDKHGMTGYSTYKCRCQVCTEAYKVYRAPRKYKPVTTDAERESRRRRTRAAQVRAQAETLATAHRYGYQWTGAEMELVGRRDLTVRQIAKMLGRTYAATALARHKLDLPIGEYMAGLSRQARSDR